MLSQRTPRSTKLAKPEHWKQGKMLPVANSVTTQSNELGFVKQTRDAIWKTAVSYLPYSSGG